MAFNDRELLARIIKCEAGGEGDDGMRAVATVIMNRVHVAVGEYMRVNQGNLTNVIFQEYQFDCARTVVGGKPNAQNIWNIPAEPIHFEIADWALGGGVLNAVGDALWYMNPYGPCPGEFPRNGSGTFLTRIGNHCFYRPTAAYART
jgi:N-acetylmuramoyl-L-alanine amidase